MNKKETLINRLEKEIKEREKLYKKREILRTKIKKHNSAIINLNFRIRHNKIKES